jgi:hypothetical protein
MDLADWSAHQLRVTLFADESFPVSEAGWRQLTGQEEAENRVNVPGGRQYSGKVLGGLLALTIMGNRLDVVLAFDVTRPDNMSAALSVPIIGRWQEVQAQFDAAVEPFFEGLTTSTVRLAFGANLLAVVPSRRHAYEELARLLKSVAVDVDHMRELIFRVNWPEKSKIIQGLEINRLTGWASQVFASNLLLNTGSGLVVHESKHDPVHTVSLEIDHNTAADRKDRFDNRDLFPIFRELVTLAEENARGGERP